MRKVSLILTVLLFIVTVPTWATVNITCSVNGNQVTVSYDSTTETKKVRAFALDISVSTGVITAVDTNVAYTPKYDIYPGTNGIKIVDGAVTSHGSPVADPCQCKDDTKPGIGHNAMTIEMGALYSPAVDPCGPPKTGVLLKFTMSDPAACVTITKNQCRGGVVLTDPNLSVTVSAPGCCGTTTSTSTTTTTTTTTTTAGADCLIGGNAGTKEKSDWVAWGKPNCWCYCRQCRGDADGKKTLANWVAVSDLNLLLSAYGKNDAALALVPNGICADFDHKKTLANRVAVSDLNILLTYYGKGTPVNCATAPIITGPYNFWCDPTGCPKTCP